MSPSLDLAFNPQKSNVLYLDLNSCFATIEQQDHPQYRNKPLVVVAYPSDKSIILASSIEAKKLGVKTGMRLSDAKLLIPQIISLPPDVDKYRYVHQQLEKIISDYTADYTSKSIDEFVLHLQNYPSSQNLVLLAQTIKSRLRSQVGDYLSLSIGLAPNRFLAKLASDLKKPDGLEEINQFNYQQVYSKLSLTDLPGINRRLSSRLQAHSIFNVSQFYQTPLYQLRTVFKSISSYYWYLRLRGWEIDSFESSRKSFGHSSSPPGNLSTLEEISPLLHKLVQKTFYRFYPDYSLSTIHLSLLYKDYSFWHQVKSFPSPVTDPYKLFQSALKLLSYSPQDKYLKTISFTCFNLKKNSSSQLNLFDNTLKRDSLTRSISQINKDYGDFSLTSADLLSIKDLAPNRISFGKS